MRTKVIIGLSGFCLATIPAFGAAPDASAHTCGRVGGVKLHAYNLGCTRARSIYGGQPAKGWTAANVDIAGGSPSTAARPTRQSSTTRSTGARAAFMSAASMAPR